MFLFPLSLKRFKISWNIPIKWPQVEYLEKRGDTSNSFMKWEKAHHKHFPNTKASLFLFVWMWLLWVETGGLGCIRNSAPTCWGSPKGKKKEMVEHLLSPASSSFYCHSLLAEVLSLLLCWVRSADGVRLWTTNVVVVAAEKGFDGSAERFVVWRHF